MWKRKQIHEDFREMYRTDISYEKLGKIEKAPFGRPWSAQKDGQTWRSPDMVQKVFGIREAKNGTVPAELVQSGKSGLVVPDVTDVLVSPSSVSTEFCVGLSLLWLGGCWTAVLFFLQQSEHTVARVPKKRPGTKAHKRKRPHYQEEATAKPERYTRRRVGTSRRGRSDVECGTNMDHCRHQTVLGRKLQRESVQMILMRNGPSNVSCPRWDTHQRKLNAPWKQKSSASARWMVARGPGKAESWMERGGKGYWRLRRD